MKKSQINKILTNQTKRRSVVLSFVCVIITFFICSITFLYFYNKKNTEQFISYSENSNIDYKVYLNENDFFVDSYLDENKQYIADLVDYISAKFNYEYELSEENISHKYSYYIDADVVVKEKTTGNVIFSQTDNLVDYKENVVTSKSNGISEILNINYNKYNDLITKFVSIYELSNIESVLNVNMFVNLQSLCDEGNKVDEKQSIISLSIPLNKQTLAVDLSNNLVNSENNILRCSVNSKFKWFMFLSIFFMIFAVIGLILLIKFISDTRSAESIYEKELKKILNNYGTYIQVLGNGFCFNDYQLLKLDSFTDMLEIRDTIRQPILMRENYQKTSAYFVIPGDTKILYIYRLNVTDIQKKINGK